HGISFPARFAVGECLVGLGGIQRLLRSPYAGPPCGTTMPLGGDIVKAAAAVGAPMPAHPGSLHLALLARAPSSVSAPLPAGKPPPAARAHRPRRLCPPAAGLGR